MELKTWFPRIISTSDKPLFHRVPEIYWGHDVGACQEFPDGLHIDLFGLSTDVEQGGMFRPFGVAAFCLPLSRNPPEKLVHADKQESELAQQEESEIEDADDSEIERDMEAEFEEALERERRKLLGESEEEEKEESDVELAAESLLEKDGYSSEHDSEQEETGYEMGYDSEATNNQSDDE